MRMSDRTASSPPWSRAARLLLFLGLLVVVATQTNAPAENKAAHLSFDQIGAAAGKHYSGAGLGISATADGARLQCVFQKLEGLATTNGLWLISTEEPSRGGRFRVVARAIGREGSSGTAFSEIGTVTLQGALARFTRPGVDEEYSVGMDGVRQDFLVTHRPMGEGQLRLELDVAGARVETLARGARLVLDGSGRKIAYGRLRVADARGIEVPARIEVSSPSLMAIIVDDAEASYPLRIDPTFSDEDWISIGMGDSISGANFVIWDTVVDGSGNLYIGGIFTFAGDVVANRIAKWDGSVWSALGSGVDGSVLALAVSGTTLFVGGSFTHAGGIAANHVAKWEDGAWSALGSGVDGSVQAMAVSGTTLFVGGSFTHAGGIAANHVAKWDGGAWSALGLGVDSNLMAFAVSGTNLYAGGYFTHAGGIAASRIARWNGNAWSAVGSGIDSDVLALAISDSNLYAGGTFTTAGGIGATNIAMWDGSAWSPLGSGLNGRVTALAMSGTNLYAGGYFTRTGASNLTYVARWDGVSWSTLGSGLGNVVEALAISGSNLFVGGQFATAGGTPALYVAKWDGAAWSALGSGLNGIVEALAVSGTDLYAGGRFTSVWGSTANYVAKWDGSAWSPLGSGLSGRVTALVMSGTNLYAGGSFNTAGGIGATNIAMWDGSAWSALGSGVNGQVLALAVSGNDLYAGGTFTRAGGVLATNIAKWDGSIWSALGSGLRGYPYALAVSGVDLYAGGNFTNAGGVATTNIARWNGSTWSALGSGVGGNPNAYVYAIVMSGSNVYAAGQFTTAGSILANRVAKWDGASWSALGSGISGTVEALVVSGNDLYAGGYFITAGGNTVNNIARWDGTAWFTLGTGMDDRVYALAVSGTNLYAGGSFSTAGGKLSVFTAKASLPIGPEIIVLGPLGTDLMCAASTTDFGTTTIGASNALTFTIRNTGTTNLAGLAVATNGADNNDFNVGPPGATNLAPGASTTFEATFAPTLSGVRVATIHIASNDQDEDPFDIALTGTGLTLLEGWRLQNFGTTENSGDAANSADPEADGAENLTEFGFGLDPRQSDSRELPVPARAADTLTVTFAEPPGVGGIAYGAEVSTDLLLWNPVNDTGSGATHTFTVPIGSNDKLFMRLKVTEP